MSDKDNAAKLADILGFDAAKHPSVTQETLQEALTEILDLRKVEAIRKAKEVLTKAIDLRRQMAQAEREFTKNQKKFDKELGKLISQLERSVSPQPGDEDEPEEETPAENNG